MSAIDFTIFSLLVLVVTNYRIARSVLYPPFIFCSMWLLDLSLYRAAIVPIDPIHFETLVIICAGAILFSIGGAFAFLVPSSLIQTRIVITRSLTRSQLVRHLAVGAICLGILVLAYQTLHALALGSGTGLLMQARDAALEKSAESGGQRSFSVMAYIVIWATFGTILLQIERRDRSFWIAAAATFVGCILTTGRTPLLFLLSAMTCVHLITTDKLTFSAALKFARWPILTFLSLYIILIFTNKDTSGFSGGVIGIIVYFLVSYLTGPTAAFDYVIAHQGDYSGAPHHTFKFFLGAASSLHFLQYTPPPVYDYFVEVPFPTNVYTVYKFYFTDFGLYGALATICIIGFLHSVLYRKAKTKSELSVYLFALTIYPVIMVIFDDAYSAFGFYIDALLVASLYMLLRTIPLRLLPGVGPRAAKVSA